MIDTLHFAGVLHDVSDGELAVWGYICRGPWTEYVLKSHEPSVEIN